MILIKHFTYNICLVLSLLCTSESSRLFTKRRPGPPVSWRQETINQDLLKQVMEMGFSEVRSEKAGRI